MTKEKKDKINDLFDSSDELFYGPEEDTHFMIEALKKDLDGSVSSSIEIGCGNGLVSKYLCTISKKHEAVDINPHAISQTKELCPDADVYESDLFEKVSGKFDLIVFNPPYLPERKDEAENWIKKAIVGGKKGYEVILKFLNGLSAHLSDEGKCYLLFSKLSVPDVINSKIDELLLDREVVLKKSVMMEDLYVVRIWKSELLLALEKKRICEFGIPGSREAWCHIYCRKVRRYLKEKIFNQDKKFKITIEKRSC